MSYDKWQLRELEPGTYALHQTAMFTEKAGTLKYTYTESEVPLKSGYSSVSDLLKAIKTVQENGSIQKVKVPLHPGVVGRGSRMGYKIM
jgi:hypothetical protein